jgi:hypothetical protein
MLNIIYSLLGLFGFGSIAAEAASSMPEWISYLLNGGPFAFVVLLLIMDKLTTPGERDRLRAENQLLHDEIKVLNQNIREEVVPPLVQINSLMREVIEELSQNRPMPPELRTGKR